jgi:hypothetical protein
MASSSRCRKCSVDCFLFSHRWFPPRRCIGTLGSCIASVLRNSCAWPWYLPSPSGRGVRKGIFRRAFDIMRATVSISKLKCKEYFAGCYCCITSTSPVPRRYRGLALFGGSRHTLYFPCSPAPRFPRRDDRAVIFSARSNTSTLPGGYDGAGSSTFRSRLLPGRAAVKIRCLPGCSRLHCARGRLFLRMDWRSP